MKSNLLFVAGLSFVASLAFVPRVNATETKHPRLYICESCDWSRDCGHVEDKRYKCKDGTFDQALRWSKKPCNELKTEQGVFEAEDIEYKEDNGIFIVPTCEVK